jgi:glutaredoxin
VVYTAEGCSLCSRALEVVREVGEDVAIALEVVDIGGDPELETRYREHLPVIEIDGERAFTHFVDPEALRVRVTC